MSEPQTTETDEIEALRETVRDLTLKLQNASAKLRAAEIAAAGVNIGDVVSYRGVRYRVTDVNPRSWGGKVWVKGNPVKKDGTFGRAKRHLYDDWNLEA